MRIINIKYCNFRNFKDEGKIEFNTDGKMTIIYGGNGAGKTTLHQLFQWIIYGVVNFNETAGEELYNTSFNYDCDINNEFSVCGSIDFVHNNQQYQIKRVQYYYKTIISTNKTKQKFSILRKNSNGDWLKVDEPEKIIEQLLPKGLSDYYFFDGERMIADLKKKGKDSAKALKNALYLLLDLKIYEDAVDVIGKKDAKTSVLGSLFSLKTDSNNQDLIEQHKKLERLEVEQDILNKSCETDQNSINEYKEKITSLSEEIGSAKSNKENEKLRKSYIVNRDNSEKNKGRSMIDFGNYIANNLHNVFLAKTIQNAKYRLEEAAENNKIIDGLDRRLIDSLLRMDKCICGNTLTETERNVLRSYYDLLPPNNYDYIRDSFIKNAQNWSSSFDIDKLKKFIETYVEENEKFNNYDNMIYELDKKMKDDSRYQSLIDDRAEYEDKLERCQNNIKEVENRLYLINIAIKKTIDKIESLSKNNADNNLIDRKISIMTDLKQYYEDLLLKKTQNYSKCLEREIQTLLDNMLEAKDRTVEISNEFKLTVKDEFGNEAKSEGQFATITFAYISGIFKLLKDEQLIDNKEFPLILDAPFSKLTEKSRRKVISTVPHYAPQVIVMSKDNLQNDIPEQFIGKVYTIKTNESFNIATIEEGFSYEN